MKKLVALLLVALLCLSLTACGKSPEAEAVDALITVIGAVTLDSVPAIEEAENAYDALTEEQKGEVDGYEILTTARQTLTALQEEAAQKEAAEKAAALEAEAARMRTNVTAKIDATGSAYLPMEDGSVLQFNGQIVSATLTACRQYAVVLERDGTLYYVKTDAPAEKTQIADTVAKVEAVRSQGVVYRNGKKELHKYIFASDTDVNFGPGMACVVAEDTLAMVSYDEQKNIFLTKSEEEDPTKVSSYASDVVQIKNVSNDGTIAMWVEITGGDNANTYKTYVYANEERVAVSERSGSYQSTYITYNEDQSFLCVYDTYDEKVYLKYGDEDFVDASLGGNVGVTVYTANGQLRYDTTDVRDGLYVTVDSSNLYYVDAEGEREKVLADVSKFEIADGRIYYINKSGELYTALLDGYSLQEEEKLSSEVSLVKCSSDGNVAYYIKNIDDAGIGSLYYWQADSKQTDKVTSYAYNTSIAVLGTKYVFAHYYVSPDGQTVLYFEDVEKDSFDSNDIGVLMSATLGSEPKKLATDVPVYSVESFRKDGHVDPRSFALEKYMSMTGVGEPDKDGNQKQTGLTNLLFCSGDETATLVKDVYYSYTMKTVVEENPQDYLPQE